jgi:hypothetical protein
MLDLNAHETNKEMDVDDAILIFFDDVDMAGSFMPLESLRNKLESAPEAARQHDDFKYLIGLFAGRQKLEQNKIMTDLPQNILDIILLNGKIGTIDVSFEKIMTMPLDELENFVECAPDDIRDLPEFGFLVGCLDGQLIIEEYGGVDQPTSPA